MEIKVLALIIQSVVVFCYILGSAILIPRYAGRVSFWNLATVAAGAGVLVGVAISVTIPILAQP